MSTFRCHACGGAVEVLAAPALQSLASSDCMTAWKGFADFKDYVHPRQPTFKG